MTILLTEHNTMVSTQCTGITTKGVQCARMVASDGSGGKLCYSHKKATTTVVTTAPDITQCMGITVKGVRCTKVVAAGKGELCSCHIGMATKISPVPKIPTVRKVVEEVASTQCVGNTLKGVRCAKMVAAGKGKLCHLHAAVPVARGAAAVATTSAQCMGTTLKGVRCARMVAAGKGQMCSTHK